MLQALFVQLQLVQAGHERGVGQCGVTQRHTDVAQHGGVCQVTLPAGDGQLLGQVLEQRIGQAQIAFGVFEVNGVDLVGHGRRTNLTGLELLLEVAQRHIAPDVTREVDQNGVGTGHGVKELGHVVVRLDLDRVGLEGQAQALGLGRLDHVLGERFPVELRPGRQVGVVVAHSAVHLAQNLDVGDVVHSLLQAHQHVGNFLAHGGRGCCLAVGAAEHGHVGKLVCHFAQLQHDAVQRWHQHHVAAHTDLQGMAGVVDVFAGAGKVHELSSFLQLRTAVKLGLDPVLHGFHVVVGGLLDLLDRRSIGLGEVGNQAMQVSTRTFGQWRKFGKTGIRQRDEPGNFNLDTTVHIALFAHDGAQGGKLGGVTAVQRGECGDGRQAHGP